MLEPHLTHPLAISLVSGAVAGGAQAVVAAPAENVRLLLEGGSYSGWSSAWKDVFRDSEGQVKLSKAESLHQARQVRQWMSEVSDMAGRGWNGLYWGMAKDSAGERKHACLSPFTDIPVLRKSQVSLSSFLFLN